MGKSCCVNTKHDMMTEMDNRKKQKRNTKVDKQLVAGVGAVPDDHLTASSQSTQDPYAMGGIDMHGMNQRDTYAMRDSMVNSYMEPEKTEPIPNGIGVKEVKSIVKEQQVEQ